jgi:putative aldouronate transport system permease protein
MRAAGTMPRKSGFFGSDRIQLLLLLLPALAYMLVFQYGPMWGAQIAFRDFIPGKGFLGSPWVGLKYFRQFFSSYYFPITLRNTVLLSLYQLIAGFPIPIALAVMLHYVMHPGAKRWLQTIFYAPNFISVTVVASMMFIMLSPSSGVVNYMLKAVGLSPVFFLAEASWFPHIFTISTVWQYSGVNAIIYLGVLSGIDPGLHESAMIDGAGKWKRILHIDFPALLPTAVILLILSFGRIMSIGFERAFLLQTPLNLSASEVIPTYVYKAGVLGTGALPRYSFASAIGLFQSTVNLALVLLVNAAAKRLSEQSLY